MSTPTNMNSVQRNSISMDTIQLDILQQVSGLDGFPSGAYNIRLDGGSIGCSSSENTTITPKAEASGIDVIVKPGTKNETIHIPVVISQSGIQELVYNDFYIGKDSEVTIIAGCGIHNDGDALAQHDGIHVFHIGENSVVRYEEKHYGEGDGTGEKILNPVTEVYLEPNSFMEMETVQIAGVDSTKRVTKGKVGDGATFIVKEKLMTHGKQIATTEYEVDLDGEDSKSHLISRSVAKGDSYQEFYSNMNGNNRCMSHSECDAIIMDHGVVKAIPVVTANHVDASLIHEAAIGKIAGEQIVKLMTLGLSEEQAEAQIVNGFLK